MADSAVLEFGGHRYQRIDGSFTWQEAKTQCESLGAHLATVTSSEENRFIINNIVKRTGTPPLDGWLGGTDAGSTGSWYWVTGENWSYNDWAHTSYTQEPNNGNDSTNYLHYSFNPDYLSGTWNDIRSGSDAGQAAICEWEPVTTTCDTTTPYNQGYTAGETAAKAACQANPASCGITVTSSGTPSTTGHASYDPLTGLVRIPYLDVPNVFGAPFIYSVDLNIINGNPLQFQLKDARLVP